MCASEKRANALQKGVKKYGEMDKFLVGRDKNAVIF